MKGFMRIITPTGHDTTDNIYGPPPAVSILQKAVGGYIGLVPYFDTLLGNQNQRCVAFCDSDGKGKGYPFNEAATKEWAELAIRAGHITSHEELFSRDHLVGTIIVLWGDDAFMGAL